VAKENVIGTYLISVFLRLHTGKLGWPAFGYKEQAYNTYILYISHIISWL